MAAQRPSPFVRFLQEAQRRRVLRVAAMYVVGIWLTLQVADVVFPGFGIPNGAIGILLLAALAGLPVALVFAWVFDVSRNGIRRTAPALPDDTDGVRPLTRRDYVTLLVFVLVCGSIVYEATSRVLHVAATGDEAAAAALLRPVPQLDRSIAVLPFANMSDDRANESFSDGISEEILNRLADFHELTVIGRTSSFAFKGKDFPIPRIAELLGVRYLLQGSVRKYGDQLRISAQLVDAAGVQVWARQFDRRLVNVFDMQAEIANEVATTVAPKVAPHVETSQRPGLDAYEQYLAGRARLHERNIPLAVRDLERAVALDDGFAEAHAELAIARVLATRSEHRFELAQADVRKALALKPGLARAEAAQAFVLLLQTPPEAAKAEALLRRVLDHDPRMSDALLWLGIALLRQGRDNEALAVQERALRVDPLHPSIVSNVASAWSRRGEDARAERLVLRTLAAVPRNTGLYLWLRAEYQRTGRLVELNRVAKQQVLNRASGYFGIALSYALFGDDQRPDYWVHRAQREHPGIGSATFLDCIPAQWQGRYRDARECMEQILRKRPDLEDDLDVQMWLGTLQGLAGDAKAAIATLGPVVSPRQTVDAEISGAEPAQVLAWSYQRAGNPARAQAIQSELEARFRELDRQGVLAHSQRLAYADDLYLDAMGPLLIGQTQLALDRLGRAIDAGWRDYYIRWHDPRWDPVRHDPRFLALMARVKADVDRQHRAVEALDAREDFVAKVDAAVSDDNARSDMTFD